MPVGIFGKLPARRDYVETGADRRLMALLDPWLQRAVAESRRQLGEGWLDAYLTAPIWRFWLGRHVAGVPALGALMPSVDGIGRYFPLCLLGAFPALPPPDADAQDEWFAAAEPLMLAALAEGGTLEALIDGVGTLPAPRAGEAPPEGGLRDVLDAVRRASPAEPWDALSCWWVPSSDAGTPPPRALVRRGLPPPVEYAAMIALDSQDRHSPAERRA